MLNVSDEALSSVLSGSTTIAAVGLTNHPGTRSYDVAAYQQSQGYAVIPVNPAIHQVLGHPSVKRIQDIEGSVDIVHVHPHHAQSAQVICDDAIQKGAKTLWLEPGVHLGSASQQLESAGVQVVRGASFPWEHKRLLGQDQI